MNPFKSWFWWKVRRKEWDSDLLKTTAMLGLMTLAGSLFNLLFHVVSSRKLGPEEYGVVGLVASIILGSTIAGLVSEMVITKFISYYRTRSQVERIMYLALSAFKIFCSLGVVVAILLLVFNRWVSSFFHLNGSVTILLLALGIVVAAVEPVLNGTLRGLQEFFQLSLLKLLDPLFRFILLGVLFILGFKTSGAVAAFALGTLGAYLFVFKYLWRWRNVQLYKVKRREILKYAIPVGWVSLGLSLLLYLDVIMAKHYLPGDLAGSYLALSMLFKLPYMVSVSMASVLFPKVVEAFSTSQEMAPYFRSVLNYHLVCSAALLVFFLAFPGWVVSTVFGSGFEGHHVLFGATLAFAMLSIINLIYSYKLAREDYQNIGLLWVALGFDAVFVFLFHRSLQDFMAVQLVLMTVLFVMVLILERKVVFEKIYKTPYKHIKVEER